MSVYLIAEIGIDDRDEYSKYEAGFMNIFSRFSGSVLAVEEEPEILEGDWPHTRTVIIQFPSRKDALEWYRSAEYQELAKHRFKSSAANIALIKGFDSGDV